MLDPCFYEHERICAIADAIHEILHLYIPQEDRKEPPWHLQRNLDALRDALSAADTRILALEKEIEDQDSTITDLEDRIDSLRDDLAEAESYQYTSALTRRQQEDLEEYTYQLRQAGSHPRIEAILTHLLAHAPVQN